jgi:hypothetical protein
VGFLCGQANRRSDIVCRLHQEIHVRGDFDFFLCEQDAENLRKGWRCRRPPRQGLRDAISSKVINLLFMVIYSNRLINEDVLYTLMS